MEILDYPSKTCEVRGAMSPGHLKLSDDKISFQHSSSGKKDVVKADDMELVNWQRIAGNWGIRVFTKDGQLHRYGGFKKGERERVAEHFKENFSMNMLDKELNVKGWNWGTGKFNGSVLGFEVGGKYDAFEIPLTYVTQCQAAKSEVTLEFSQNDNASVNLAEIRFHIPINQNSEEQTTEDPAEAFKEYVMKKANISTASTGNDIATFREINSLSPRGRYDIKFYSSFVHLHGKTFDYKIPVGSIMRLILLPHKDQRQMFFCVNLDPPIKQGQTRYHYLVFSFMQDEETEIELPFTEEELQEKYEGKLEKEMKGPTFELVSKLMKALVNKKITVPGNFVGHSGTSAVSCSYKAASGFIYPLERSFMFVYKPPIFIRYDDVKNVNFARSGGSNRSFDIEVSTRGEATYTFSSIEKDEYTKLYDFLKSKKISVKSTGKMDASGSKIPRGDLQDTDHNLAMVKADAASDESSASMSSDDTDFNPDQLEAKSAKEEYDSDPSDTGSDTDPEAMSGSGSELEQKKAEKAKRRAERQAKKKTSRPTERSETKKKKKTKLPGQPKKPLSAYFLWMTEVGREKVKEDNPGISITEVSKKGGELWREMDPDEKKIFENRAKEGKEAYDKEYKDWLESGGAEAIKQAKKEAKAEKKASKSGGGGGGGGSANKSPAKPKKEPTGGSGSGFKSKEFIEDSDSDSGKDGKKSSDDAGDNSD